MTRLLAAYLGALVCIAWAAQTAWAYLRRRRESAAVPRVRRAVGHVQTRRRRDPVLIEDAT